MLCRCCSLRVIHPIAFAIELDDIGMVQDARRLDYPFEVRKNPLFLRYNSTTTHKFCYLAHPSMFSACEFPPGQGNIIRDYRWTSSFDNISIHFWSRFYQFTNWRAKITRTCYFADVFFRLILLTHVHLDTHEMILFLLNFSDH